MRRQLPGFGVIAFTAAALFAADKDTPLAANTRTKRLQTKITVDIQDQPLRDAFGEINKQLEDAGAGAISHRNDLGVSDNQRVTVKADGKTVAEVLDVMLKKNGLGYVVVSKAGDRYDGWLLVKQGNERGWPAGQEPKDKGAAKATPKAAPESKAKSADPPATAGDAEKAEKVAASKLDFARSLVKDGKTDRAKQRLRELIEQYPNTKAAGEAKKELDKLGP